MSRYTPFLKFKQNEIAATALVIKNHEAHISPFFDIPRPQKVSADSIIKRLAIGKDALEKHLPDTEFYIDNFDLDDTISLGGKSQYQFILEFFEGWSIIPVVGLHREESHISHALLHAAVYKKIAVRLLPQDIESYRLTKLQLQALWRKINAIEGIEVHLILDFRVITKNPADLAALANTFITSFHREFLASKCVVTSSSISPFVRDIVGTKASKSIPRKEWLFWNELSRLNNGAVNLHYGDYCAVSPDYTDMEVEVWMMQNVATPKVFYTYENHYFVCRGGAFKTHVDGYRQYFSLADLIAGQAFFRKGYSFGEKYISERCSSSPKRPKAGGSPGSWLKATLVSHMAYTCACL